MPSPKPVVLVTAANGDQGRAVARRFLRRGYRVRALVTDFTKPAAQSLAAAGAEVVTGDLTQPADVARAVADAAIVYAVPVGSRREQDKAGNARVLIEAAKDAGVGHFIQTTVADAPNHLGFRVPGLDYDLDAYANARLEIERLVKEAGFTRWTILQPVTFMENLTVGKAAHLFPWLAEGRLDSLLKPETRVQYVACGDIAAFALAAAESPDRFTGRTIALASEALTVEQLAGGISAAVGVPITHATLTTGQALERGMAPGVAFSQQWCNEIGYRAPLADELEATWGVRPLTFRAWAEAHRHVIAVGVDTPGGRPIQ